MPPCVEAILERGRLARSMAVLSSSLVCRVAVLLDHHGLHPLRQFSIFDCRLSSVVCRPPPPPLRDRNSK